MSLIAWFDERNASGTTLIKAICDQLGKFLIPLFTFSIYQVDMHAIETWTQNALKSFRGQKYISNCIASSIEGYEHKMMMMMMWVSVHKGSKGNEEADILVN